MKPLYMWAGGKSKMIKKYLSSPGIPHTGFDTYVEPFFGAGAMMIYVHENCPDVKKFVINDVNPYLIGIYNAIKNDVDNFTSRMNDLESQYLPLKRDDSEEIATLTLEGEGWSDKEVILERKFDSERKSFYKKLLEEYITDWKKWDPTTESATLYFLMKTGFNGIWQKTEQSGDRFATPAGLLNQKDRVYDYKNVMKWHSFLQKADIHCGDWLECMNKIDSTEKSFLFADPPYRDSFTSYAQDFSDEEHTKLINFCEKFSKNNTVFLCNRDDGGDFFSSRVNNLSISKYDVTYTAGRRQDKKKNLSKLENRRKVLEKKKAMNEKKRKALEDRATLFEKKNKKISGLENKRSALEEKREELQLKLKEVNAEIKKMTNNQNFEAKKATEVLLHNFSERKE